MIFVEWENQNDDLMTRFPFFYWNNGKKQIKYWKTICRSTTVTPMMMELAATNYGVECAD
jgi:hypothetical protein